MNLYIHNTLTNRKDLFIPNNKHCVNMYVCGPTVYSSPHIGNARAALTGDLFFRLLSCLYKKVKYIRNLTDVDDKIILEAKKRNISIEDLTKDIATIYQTNMLDLNMLKPTLEPKVTENINNIISVIEKIIENKSAYISEKHVVFDTTSFVDYGALSKKISDDLIDGARVKPESFKRNPKDFVLWKPSIDSNYGWESPWGFGRPGWHIECTSMIKNIIGMNETLDLHGGGNDLIFPHHENEIAQGSCCSDSKFCNYWFHNGIVLVNKKKMSKSLGNVILVSEILNQYNPLEIRLALMATHYRQPLNWTNDTIINARNILNKIKRPFEKLEELESQRDDAFLEILCDDMNTPNAIKYLQTQAKSALIKNEEIHKLKFNCELLGLPTLSTFAKKLSADEISKINELMAERETARKNKDFNTADRIRDKLLSMDVIVEDGSSGATWKLKH